MTTPPTVDLKNGLIRPATQVVVQKIVRAILKVAFGLHVHGTDNIPKSGPFIVVSNHLHNGDPIIVVASCPRLVMFIAKAELFDIPVIRRIIRWVGAFPVHRGKMDRNAIKHAQRVLDEGYGLGIFPEGTRSKSRQIERVLPGAGLFALRGKIPVIPCAIVGSENLPFNGAKQAKQQGLSSSRQARGVTLTFGEPFTLPAEIDGKKTNADMATDYMMCRVAALLPTPYRGIYSGSDSSSSSSSPRS